MKSQQLTAQKSKSNSQMPIAGNPDEIPSPLARISRQDSQLPIAPISKQDVRLSKAERQSKTAFGNVFGLFLIVLNLKK